jgi:hypothetical protein
MIPSTIEYSAEVSVDNELLEAAPLAVIEYVNTLIESAYDPIAGSRIWDARPDASYPYDGVTIVRCRFRLHSPSRP